MIDMVFSSRFGILFLRKIWDDCSTSQNLNRYYILNTVLCMDFILLINSIIQTIHTLCLITLSIKSIPVKPKPQKWLYIVGFVSVSLPFRIAC